jgi:predicted DNA-binding transcriptional regulator YafY
MRNQEVIRQWQVLREIEARRVGVTIHELADLVGVSTRTVRRDLQALQEAGFAIFDEGATNETKRWRLDGSPFKAVQEGLTVADVAALYLSRAVVEGVSGWPLARELGAAFAKLERALNPRMREFLSTLPQVITAKAGPRTHKPSGQMVDVTRRLFDAVRDRRVVAMAYFSAASNRSKSYTVQPYQLTLAQGGVYLVGWVVEYDEFRTFAAERIERLSVREETFTRSRSLPVNLFGSSLGVFSGEPQRVEVEFDARAALFVRGRLWHESQQMEELPDGRLRVVLDVTHDWALRSWLLGFGSAARVTAPAALARELAAECAAMQQGHEAAARTPRG